MHAPTDPATKRGRRDRGAVLPFVAMLMPVLVLMTAFAVDLGMQRASRRTMQARADIVALDMVRLADGRTEQQILGDSGYGPYLTGSATRNEVAVGKLTVDYGTIEELVDAQGVVTGLGPFIPTLPQGIPNAVKVTSAEEVDYFFRPGNGSTTRSAIAATDKTAGFQIGSKLVSLDTSKSTMLNNLLNGTLGTNLALGAATYNGIIGSGVNIGRLATQLGFGSPEELANANVGAGDLLLASSQVLQQDGQTAAANVLNTIALQTDEDAVVDMGQLLEIGAGGGRESAVNAGFDVFNLLTGTAYAVNGSETVSVPGVGLNLPGVASTTLGINVIESPRAVFGRVGKYVDTQQASIKVANQLTTSGITLGLINITGTVEVTQSVAGARGTLTAIACGASPGISVGVTPQPVTTSAKLQLSVRVLGIPVATIATTLAAAPNGSSGGGSFAYTNQFLPPVGTGTMTAAPASPLGLADLLKIGNTDVTLLGVLPLGQTLGGIVGAVNNSVLNPLLTTLDPLLTGPLSDALGLQLGAADVGALDMTCSNVKLVG